MFSTSTVNRVITDDYQAHIHDTRLFWVYRHGRPLQRSWNELTEKERKQQREAEARAYYTSLFHIY